ncbi:hypothetical protein [Methylomonas sp. MgM2]
MGGDDDYDQPSGGYGSDTLSGGPGKDKLTGNNGNDRDCWAVARTMRCRAATPRRVMQKSRR